MTFGLILLSLVGCVVVAQSGWTSSRKGMDSKDLNTVFFVDSRHGWIAGDAGFVSRTDDGGVSWVQQKVDTSEAINDLYFRNKDNGFLLAGGRIFNTVDGGLSWTAGHAFSPVDFGGAQPELYSIRFSNKNKGWVVGSLSRAAKNGDSLVIDSLLYKTSDGGDTWERQRLPSKEELIHLDFVNEKHGWIVGTSGTVLHTDDGGETWMRQQSRTKSTLFHVDFRNEKKGLAVGEHGTILRTVDGGETWTIVALGVKSTLLSVQFLNDDDGWIAGRAGTILRTGDGGLTWIKQTAPTEVNLYALFFDKKNGWAVGGSGLVLHYLR
jgi:photosystem II stability/assembly factor-like uncharacterized protein